MPIIIKNLIAVRRKSLRCGAIKLVLILFEIFYA